MKLLQNRKCLTLQILASLIVIVFFYSYAPASVNYCPTDGWQISAPEAQGMHSKPILEMMQVIKKNGWQMYISIHSPMEEF